MKSCDLDQRKKTTDDQGSGNQILLDLRFQIRSALSTEDDGGCDDTRQHSERMLKAQYQREDHGHVIVEAKERWTACGLLGERQTRCEEKLVVIVADEALLGGERTTDGRETGADGFAWLSVGGRDLRWSWFVHRDCPSDRQDGSYSSWPGGA